MSPGAARDFLPALREVDRQLRLPLPDRVRILRELEYDLEELRDRLVGQGLSPVEARLRSREVLVPTGLVLRQLSEVHRPFYQRLTLPLRENRLRLLERSLLAVATGAVLVTQTVALTRADLLSSPSPFLWPELGVGALLFAAILAKTFELWIKQDHRSPGRGLPGLLVLAGVAFAIGIGGTTVDLYRLAGMVETAPDRAQELGAAWLLRDSALLSISTLVALAGALAWFVMAQWLALVSSNRREVLGL